MTQPAAAGPEARTARARLIDAAIAQLAAEGMRGLTHRRVEQRAEVAQGLVKYHFGSLDGLIAAVLTHLADAELPDVLTVDDQTRALADAGRPPTALFAQARAVADAVRARPDLARARLELYLHASRHPELQGIVKAARDRFVDRIAASLDGPDPEAGARMIVALVDGLLLDQLSAPEALVDEMMPTYWLIAGAAARSVPARPSA
jgi:DNA-binding transcriptional regulator YbjK